MLILLAMNKHTVARLSLMILLGAGLWTAHVYGQFGAQASKLDVVKIKDDLYVIHNDFVPGNTTALITNEGVMLVDDKFEIDYANIVAEVKKLTNQPIKYVINTHHHGDHSGGNAKAAADECHGRARPNRRARTWSTASSRAARPSRSSITRTSIWAARTSSSTTSAARTPTATWSPTSRRSGRSLPATCSPLVMRRPS